MNEISYCRGCGKMLKFLRTRRGALMPCDSFPVRYVPDENGTLLYNEDGTSFRGRIVDKSNTGAALAWVPHFGRCTNPVDYKKTGREPSASGSRPERRSDRAQRAFPHAGTRKREIRDDEEEARRHAAQKQAKEEYDRTVQELLAQKQREWTERQQSLF